MASITTSSTTAIIVNAIRRLFRSIINWLLIICILVSGWYSLFLLLVTSAEHSGRFAAIFPLIIIFREI